MRLLDLFCCAGGAAMGYHRAGFDVVGVDNRPQPRYPFEFHRGDALEYLAVHGAEFDAVHASPPCQDHSAMRTMPNYRPHGTARLLPDTRAALVALGRPWIIENVPGAPMRPDVILCGSQFGLPGLRRHRWFETSWQAFDLAVPCSHVGYAVTVVGEGGRYSKRRPHIPGTVLADAEAAMGIDWMTRKEIVQAIPPAYTEYLGGMLLDVLCVRPT
jgi:DNA (cytosine-5)-methyltransferase 1